MTLYSYDDDPDDLSLENNMRQSISLIARMPAIMTYAYQVKRRHYDKQTMFFHPFEPQHRTAEAILNALREDRSFTREEAELLDLCMVMHAEHGGGNNSTFTARVLSSAHTDIYSTIAAAIGSLKGFRHGGANHKVRQMMTDIMQNVQHWDSDDEVEAYLERILRREVGDRSGLIYGMGHAIYTISDPRASSSKSRRASWPRKRATANKFALYERIEALVSGRVQNGDREQKKSYARTSIFIPGLSTRCSASRRISTRRCSPCPARGWAGARQPHRRTRGEPAAVSSGRPTARCWPSRNTFPSRTENKESN